MVEKVFALGGSVIKQKIEELEKIATSIEQNPQFVAVTGAGHLKKHQEAVKEECTKAETDLVGIKATRLNARTLQSLTEDTYPEIPQTLEEVRKAAFSGGNVTMGGLNPGFSTDAVAAVVAELFDADLYLVKDVDGVYTEDPEENPEAEKIDEIKIEELTEMTSGENEPGVYSIVDETASKIIQRSNLNAKVFKGTLENIENPEGAEGTKILT
jgi:uridylate kinase